LTTNTVSLGTSTALRKSFTDARSGAALQTDFNLQIDALFKNLIHVQAGPSVSALHYYDGGNTLVGFDDGYRGGVTLPFNQHYINLGYKEGTPTPYNATTSWGPFATFANDGTIRNTYLRQYSLSSSRPLGKHVTLGAEFDGTLRELTTRDRSRSLAAHDRRSVRPCRSKRRARRPRARA